MTSQARVILNWPSVTIHALEIGTSSINPIQLCAEDEVKAAKAALETPSLTEPEDTYPRRSEICCH